MRASFTPARLCACLVVWNAAAIVAPAQTTLGDGAFQNRFPDPVRYTQPVPDAPELRLELVAQIELAGPLASGPRWNEGRVEIQTASGPVRATWSGEPGVEPVAAGSAFAPGEPEPTWAVSPDGRHRASAIDGLRLLFQKACRGCSTGWRGGWRLRVPGLAPVAPLITARRVYYGAADNRVYGVKRKNGHRVWAAALDGRVARPLTLWVSPETARDAAAAILAVPEPGTELIVLDALGGRLSLRYRLPGEGDKIVGSPLAAPDGHVIVARQGYSDQDAGLIVLKILESGPDPDPPGESPATGYNRRASEEAAPVDAASDSRADLTAPGSTKVRGPTTDPPPGR